MPTDSPHPAREVRPPTSEDLARARDVIAAHLAPTPLVPATIGGRHAALKLETLQPTGSFKVRGALAAVSALRPGQRILAVSAGNHALGIAWAASRLDIPATVVIAETASPAKRAKLERLPIELVRHGQSYDEAESHALAMTRNAPVGTAFISAYNDPLVIAGSSAVLDEIVTQHPGDDPLTVVVPAGGGGLLAGTTLRAAELATASRPIRVVGVESAMSRGLSASVAAGQVVDVPVGDTIADGLSGNIEPGSVTVEIIRHLGPGLVAVTDEEIEAAIRFLATDHGIVAEGAGAVAVAALLTGKVAPDGDIVAIVSGRNIALPRLAAILAPPATSS